MDAISDATGVVMPPTVTMAAVAAVAAAAAAGAGTSASLDNARELRRRSGPWWKIMRRDEVHRGVQFGTGEFTDPVPWSKHASSGIYFCRTRDVVKWLSLYHDAAWVRCVTVPADAHMHRERGRAKADRVILGERVPLGTWLNEQLEMDWDAVLFKYPEAIRFAPPTSQRWLDAMHRRGRLLRCVEEQTPALCMAAVTGDGMAIADVKVLTPELVLAAVQRTGKALGRIPRRMRTPEACLAAVMADGNALEDVPDGVRTPELLLAAVTKTGRAIRFARGRIWSRRIVHGRLQMHKLESTTPLPPHLCMAAVLENGLALEFLCDGDEQTPELVHAAITNTPWAIRHVRPSLQTEALQLLVIRKDPALLPHLHAPSPAVVAEATAAIAAAQTARAAATAGLAAKRKAERAQRDVTRKAAWKAARAELSAKRKKVAAALKHPSPALAGDGGGGGDDDDDDDAGGTDVDVSVSSSGDDSE